MRRIFTVALAALGALAVTFLVYLLWPGSSTRAGRSAEQKALQQELAAKKRDAAPLLGIDAKLSKSRDDVKKLHQERVPSRFSDISGQLHKLAQENGVSAQRIQYETENAGVPGIARIKIGTNVSGDYMRIAHFINAVERDKLLFVIRQISLNEQQAGSVELQIKFETYLKEKS
jgi:Tfp pilus assembly protein PilO